MRTMLAGGVIGLLLLVSPGARAGGTLDLLWLDTGTAYLASGLPGTPQPRGCGGFHNPVPDQFGTRCLGIRFTVDESWHSVIFIVAFNTGNHLTALYATQFLTTTIGKTSITSVGTPRINNGTGEIDDFFAISKDPSEVLPPGTYSLGTIVFDIEHASPGPHAVGVFFRSDQGFFDAAGEDARDRFVFHFASIATEPIPEPGTAALLAAGLLGLSGMARRLRGRR